jgi:hypothetical protein
MFRHFMHNNLVFMSIKLNLPYLLFDCMISFIDWRYGAITKTSTEINIGNITPSRGRSTQLPNNLLNINQAGLTNRTTTYLFVEVYIPLEK